MKKGAPIFGGTSQYERFHKIFHDVLEDNKGKILDLGVKKWGIGTHSC